MALKDVTVSLPEELVRAARQIAIDRGLSLSAYLARLIEENVLRQRPASEARDRIRQRIHEGIDFGIRDGVTWTRESLHRR
ncbi:MAG: hypothetical protein EPO26_17180 [Chloroflexota bacterium]|nr:MAG: hypothetical protein EPO26_17180 [Chloroflexota bacterium]